VWQSKTVIRILKNPAITGVRVMTPKTGKKGDTPVPVYGNDGRPVRVADALVSDDDFKKIQNLITAKARKDRSSAKNASPFLSILKHGHCGANVTLHTVKRGERTYQYLRCISDSVGSCGQGFSGISPTSIYETITHAVMSELGNYQVVERHYVRGQEEAARAKHLQDTIQHYLRELAPGGQFSQGGFLEDMARKNLDEASKELQSIDPASLLDRWEYKNLGKTFAERWQEGGLETMQMDLRNAGVTVELHIKEVDDPDDRVHLHVNIPKDVEERLIMKPDAFSSPM
jgi:hypothetical protein